ncbi:MAG: SPOR domain-containing protein [Flavobacteriales bacterium]
MRIIPILIPCLLWISTSVAQNSASKDTGSSDESSDTSGFVFRPTVGLGTGMLTFYGDVGKDHRFYHPTVSRVGYELKVSNPLTPWLDLGFHVMRGKLAANERFPHRNLNFESRVTTGGFNLTYNFEHILPPDRKVEPFLSVGLESFEFLSKTDLYDENGNRYHYWSDGTIRDRPEASSNASEAKILTRDYTYETDLRELNLDGFGDYPERSWAIPVSVGAEMHLSERVDMRLSSSMYFSFTDYIDNVTHQSKGDRQGDPANDKYLYTSVSIHYDLQVTPFKEKKPKEEKGRPLRDFRFDGADEDKDGVVDFLDECAHSPAVASVDSNGCPLDQDNDAVPDHTDRQKNTNDTLLRRVDSSGVPLTDQQLKHRYLVYMDSTGRYTKVKDTVRSRSSSERGKLPIKKKFEGGFEKKRFMVKVGQSTKGISPQERDRLLSISDVRTIDKGDTAIYVVGNYKKLPDAVRRKFKLEAKGVEGDLISKQGDQIQKEEVTYAQPGKESGKAAKESKSKNKVVFRVQLGAFNDELSQDIFRDVPQLLVLHGEDGLVRYVTGSFSNVKKAAEHKTEMYLKGYKDAFITAYQNGERIPLAEAGAKVTGEEDLNKVRTGSVDKEMVGFSIQIGAYKKDIPTDKLQSFMELGQVRTVVEGGVTKYLYGDFESKEAAKKKLSKVKEAGIESPFVVGSFKRSVIPAEEAQTLKEQGE